MRVSLVQAPVFDHRTPSNALALLAALLKRENIETRIHDANKCISSKFEEMLSGKINDARTLTPVFGHHKDTMERLLDEEATHILASDPDAVGFSVLARTEKHSLDLARRIKRERPSTRIIFGGAQCLRENLAEEFIRHQAVDAVALSEADISFPTFLRSLKDGGSGLRATPGMLVKENGGIVDGGDPPAVADLDSLPFLDFEQFDLEAYNGDILYLSTTRGCVRKCSFCTHILGQKVYRTMSAKRTVAEIRHQIDLHPERRIIEFNDSLVNGNVRRLAEIADLLIDYRLERVTTGRHASKDFGWLGMAILHPTMTPELLRKLRFSGCIKLKYGMESASQKVLDSMQKKLRVADAERVIFDTWRAGISVFLFILVGFPTESESDFQQTLDFIERNVKFIDHVGVSSCEIQKGSHMDAHPELYGIKTPIEDRLRWSTSDGRNRYEIRQDRLGRMQKLLRRLNLLQYEFPTRLGITLDKEPEYNFYESIEAAPAEAP